jgi:uncharacterized phage protein (TIGR01671 family)
MSPINFRAWDKKRGIMHYNIELYGKNKPCFASSEELSFEDFIIDKERFIIMQFTGLLDCKGSKVFDEDIIKIRNEFTAKVEWDKSFYAFCTFDIFGRRLLYEDATILEYNEISELFNCTDIKILGNIYENPKMLKRHRKNKKLREVIYV